MVRGIKKRDIFFDDLTGVNSWSVFLTCSLSPESNARRNWQVSEVKGAICFIAGRKLGFCGVEIAKALKVTCSGVVSDARRRRGCLQL